MREKLLNLYRSVFARGWASKWNYFAFDCAVRGLGVMNYGSDAVSGEEFLIANFLPRKIGAEPVLFDVGANVGNYSAALLRQFPAAKIFAFEPNPKSFERLQSRFTERIECLNMA